MMVNIASEKRAQRASASETADAARSVQSANLRDRVVRFGIRAVCGAWADIEQIQPTAAADIPLVSAGLRFAWLRVLERIGVTSTIATSALGHRFVCHIGDYAEFPYYHRKALAPELALCAEWLRDEDGPVIYDLGANVGFFSTQLCQILAARKPQIYAFEPVPSTFAKLVHAVHRLGLLGSVHPIAAAVLDNLTIVDITLPDRNSLLSQVVQRKSSGRIKGHTTHAPAITLDAFHSKFPKPPVLIKIDIEGSEASALRGARDIINGNSPPAIALEFSPRMLAECGENVDDLSDLMSGYRFYYVDDIIGQKLAYGSVVASLHELKWTCNLFAVPERDGNVARCAAAFESARQTLQMQR